MLNWWPREGIDYKVVDYDSFERNPLRYNPLIGFKSLDDCGEAHRCRAEGDYMLDELLDTCVRCGGYSTFCEEHKQEVINYAY